jgi:hypothetical protein
MDLSPKDFTQAFLDTEVRKLTLKSMKGGTVYLRALSRADTTRFRQIADTIEKKTSIAVFSGPEVTKIVSEKCYNDAKDYLIFKLLCNKDGQRFFSELDVFNEWCEDVGEAPVQEMLEDINKNITLYQDTGEEHEKKLPSSE